MDADVLEEPAAYIFKVSLSHEDGGNRILRNGNELNLKPDLRIMKQIVHIQTVDCLEQASNHPLY
jgi:nitrogen fixation protein